MHADSTPSLALRRPTMTVLVLAAAAIVVSAPAAAPERKLRSSPASCSTTTATRADRVRLPTRCAFCIRPTGREVSVRRLGYRIRSIGAANGKQLAILVVEKRAADPRAKPSIRYKRTRSKPVRDRAGSEAAAQLFRRVRAHGRLPAAGQPPTSPPPSPAPADRDGDGTLDAQDCAPDNEVIKPGAADAPTSRSSTPTATASTATSEGDLRVNARQRHQPRHEGEAETSDPAAVAAARSPARRLSWRPGTYGHVQGGDRREHLRRLQPRDVVALAPRS